MKKTIFLLCLFNLLFLSQIVCSSQKNDNHSLKPLQISSIGFLCNNDDLSFEKIKKLPVEQFRVYEKEELRKDSVYWFRIVVDSKNICPGNYYIHFNCMISNIELYQYADGTWRTSKGEAFTPQNKTTEKGYLKNKVSMSIQANGKTLLFLRIQNQLSHKYELENMRSISRSEYEKRNNNTDFFQGCFQGMMIILMLLNFILHGFSQNRVYLYYALYILFLALFFFYYFQFADSYLFCNNPKLDISIQWSIYAAQFIYLLFFLEVFKDEQLQFPLWKKRIKFYTKFMFFICLLILVLGHIDYRLSFIISNWYTILNIFFVIVSFFVFYKKAKVATRIILTGASFMVIGALISMSRKFSVIYDDDMLFYQTGVFIELLLFTMAINHTYIKDQLKNIEILHQNSLLEFDATKKEKENCALKEKIDYKNRVLTAKAIELSEKETLISDLIKQLRDLKSGTAKKADIQRMIGNLKAKLTNNSWDEFEVHFNKTHPQFYSALNEKYPNLTAGERKLCAFLKLNMTTKDIAAINGKSLNTIDVARGRLRKKMNLTGNENLQSVISHIC